MLKTPLLIPWVKNNVCTYLATDYAFVPENYFLTAHRLPHAGKVHRVPQQALLKQHRNCLVNSGQLLQASGIVDVGIILRKNRNENANTNHKMQDKILVKNPLRLKLAVVKELLYCITKRLFILVNVNNMCCLCTNIKT